MRKGAKWRLLYFRQSLYRYSYGLFRGRTVLLGDRIEYDKAFVRLLGYPDLSLLSEFAELI